MKVIEAKTKKEVIDNMLVRGQVFVVEQQIDWALEYDGLDAECILFNAYIGEKCVGAARLNQNIVGRVATLKEHRHKGVGALVMKSIEEYATVHNIKELELHAQYYIKDFYLHLGYSPIGEIYQEAGIDHITMKKTLI